MYGVSEEVMELFQRYDWPGNIRELKNCLKSATVNSQGDVILKQDLPTDIQTYSRDEGPERDVPETGHSETSETPVYKIYKNLFDLPVVVFCQFISDTKSDVPDSQIAEWWIEFSNDGHNRANRAEREIGIGWWIGTRVGSRLISYPTVLRR